MEVDVAAVQKLIEERFRGNLSWFAEEIGVNNAYISTLFSNNGKVDSSKIIVGIIKYCEKNGINFRKYIIFLK